MQIGKMIYQLCGGLFLVGLILNCQPDDSLKVLAGFFMFLAVVVGFIRLLKDAMKKITQMTKDGEKDILDYREKHERFGIPYGVSSIKVLDSGTDSRFKIFNGSECKAWINEDMFNIYHDEVLTGIEIKDIKCFARIGDIKQGEYSFSNAVAGYLLLGVAGAIIGEEKIRI